MAGGKFFAHSLYYVVIHSFSTVTRALTRHAEFITIPAAFRTRSSRIRWSDNELALSQ